LIEYRCSRCGYLIHVYMGYRNYSGVPNSRYLVLRYRECPSCGKPLKIPTLSDIEVYRNGNGGR